MRIEEGEGDDEYKTSTLIVEIDNIVEAAYQLNIILRQLFKRAKLI